MYIKSEKTVQGELHNIEYIIKELNKEKDFNLELVSYNPNTQKFVIIDKDTKEIIIEDFYNNLKFYAIANFDLLKLVIKKHFY